MGLRMKATCYQKWNKRPGQNRLCSYRNWPGTSVFESKPIASLKTLDIGEVIFPNAGMESHDVLKTSCTI